MLGVPPFVPLGAATLFAAILGIQLGNSTVAAIKPTFFLGAPVHPRDRGAAVDPRDLEVQRLERLQNVYNSLYGWDEGHRALQLACVQCGAGGPEPRPAVYDARVPYFGSREERAAEDAAARRATDARYQAREQAAEARAIARYADFPIAQEDVEEAADAEPEAAPPSTTDEHDPTA